MSEKQYPVLGKIAKQKAESRKQKAGVRFRPLVYTLLLVAFFLLPTAVHAQGSAQIKIVTTVPAACNANANNSPVMWWKVGGSSPGLYICVSGVPTYQTNVFGASLVANRYLITDSTPTIVSSSTLSLPISYSSASSFQIVGPDLTLAAGAGKDVATGTSYLASGMFNVVGASLTKTGNYLGGVVGAYSITGTRATHYPAGAVLGQITDGVTDVNGAFVAYIDGDSAQTNAVAGLAFMNNNSTAASGFDWAIDAYSPAHDGFNALGFKKGFARIVVNAAPSSPPATSIATWGDSTDNNFKSKDSSGNISQTVRALTSVDGQVVTSMPSTGVLTTSTAEIQLSTTAAVNMNTATATTLYTSPTGRSTVVTKVVVRNCSTSMTTASYSFGWEAATFANVIANATHTELTGATLYTRLDPKVGATVGTTTGTFKVLMNTLQGGAATCTMDVFGYTF